METSEVCVLCEKTLIGEQIVKVQKGIKNIKRMSVLRNDNMHILLENKDSVEVHTKCRYMYIRRIKEKEQESNEESRRELRRLNFQFDFKTICLFCAEVLDNNHPNRNPISLVSTMKIKDNIIKICNERNDEWGNNVLVRVNSVKDLVASEARYHKSCYTLFNRHGSNPKGKSNLCDNKSALNLTKHNAFYQLCDFLENNYECQYDIKELMAIMKEKSLDGEEVYSEKYVKMNLKSHYGDAICMTSKSGKWTIGFRGTASRILNDRWYKDKLKNNADERMRIVEAAAIIIKEDIYSFTCEYNNYPCVEEIASGGYNVIPDSLKCLL
ncbi:unnamed protein product [Psylliodes chrysocephalus]|uniref:Uncharacterized protein n=1 Tax=Psylliodes chrysocephalus TaxID=3402493 RepID=A0A9P0G6U6_9CUCU|nr:unnamed protein product [Psylliodes chrysocephala]